MWRDLFSQFQRVVDIGGFHLCTPTNYINRNTLLSSNYMLQMFILFSMGKFAIHVNGLCYFICYHFIHFTYACVSWMLRTSCKYQALDCELDSGLLRTSGRGRILAFLLLAFPFI